MFSQKRKLVLFNTKELSRVSSINIFTLYISGIVYIYLYLAYSKCYEFIDKVMISFIMYDIIIPICYMI